VTPSADDLIILDKGRVVAVGELAQLTDELVAGNLVV